MVEANSWVRCGCYGGPQRCFCRGLFCRGVSFLVVLCCGSMEVALPLFCGTVASGLLWHSCTAALLLSIGVLCCQVALHTGIVLFILFFSAAVVALAVCFIQWIASGLAVFSVAPLRRLMDVWLCSFYLRPVDGSPRWSGCRSLWKALIAPMARKSHRLLQPWDLGLVPVTVQVLSTAIASAGGGKCCAAGFFQMERPRPELGDTCKRQGVRGPGLGGVVGTETG